MSFETQVKVSRLTSKGSACFKVNVRLSWEGTFLPADRVNPVLLLFLLSISLRAVAQQLQICRDSCPWASVNVSVEVCFARTPTLTNCLTRKIIVRGQTSKSIQRPG